MMEILKSLGKFFKNKKVQIWACLMAGVIVVAFGVMSWIMVTDKIVFAQVSTDSGIKFDFVPNIRYVDTITIANTNEDLTRDTVQLDNNRIKGEFDPVALPSEAKAVEDIMARLNKGRKTNAFLQFFTGGKSGEERLTNTSTGSWTFQEVSQGVWIKIVFAYPQFVVNRDNNSMPWRLEEFNPNYTRPVDENDRPYGQTVRQYNNSVVNAIHIPLGGVRNAVTQQTWYLSVGTKEISNTSTLSYTFTTYGNYHSLLKYVNSIDDATLL